MARFSSQTGVSEAKRVSDYLGQLFSRSIRAALIKGLEAATRATYQDSSQAAAHWMLAGSKSRPRGRKPYGKLTYARGSTNKAPLLPVGYRGDKGANSEAVVKFVSVRELDQVVSKLVAGRSPEFKFYLYNAVGDVNEYSTNAKIDAAGQEGVRVVIEEAERQIQRENTRKITLR